MIHVKRGTYLERDAAAIGLSLDEDARNRLRELEGLLAERATEIGLISSSDADRVYDRHVLDCLRAAPLLVDADRALIDIGSGAGLPGLVLACARPDLGVTLVDSRRRAGASRRWSPGRTWPPRGLSAPWNEAGRRHTRCSAPEEE
jgi:16S rRNA G527 N7-methylase RsmG